MTKNDAIEILKTSATVENMWLLKANQIEVGEYDNWYDEIKNIGELLNKRNENSFNIMTINSLNFNDIGVVQYFIFMTNGKNGSSDYMKDVLEPITNFFKIVKESGADWVNICDYYADIIDDTYAWVLTFTVKNIDKN